MRLIIAYFKIKKGNLVLINNDTYQRETLSERPIRQPLRQWLISINDHFVAISSDLQPLSIGDLPSYRPDPEASPSVQEFEVYNMLLKTKAGKKPEALMAFRHILYGILLLNIANHRRTL